VRLVTRLSRFRERCGKKTGVGDSDYPTLSKLAALTQGKFAGQAHGQSAVEIRRSPKALKLSPGASAPSG
jgi:hypothetical protein